MSFRYHKIVRTYEYVDELMEQISQISQSRADLEKELNLIIANPSDDKSDLYRLEDLIDSSIFEEERLKDELFHRSLDILYWDEGESADVSEHITLFTA